MGKKKNVLRKDGRIAVQVYIGRVEGKRKYKTVYGYTQKEADDKALQIKIALRKGLNIESERDTFKEWSDRWIEVKQTEVSLNQYKTYQSLAKHLNSHIGDTAINKVRTADIQDIILELARRNPNTKKPTSKKTLGNVRITAKQIFQMAIENRVMDYNPANAVKIPQQAPQTSRRALTDIEQRWITDTPHSAQRAAMLMMYAGLRRGELIPLMWNDIDLKNATITINKAVEKDSNKFIIKNRTKTAAGMRVIDIPKRLVDYLEDEPKQSIYVCVNAKGRFHTESSWSRMWESYLADLNIKYGDFSAYKYRAKSKFDPNGVPFVIPRITPHWLRHTFATMLYLAGVDILTAKEQLGHKDINVTLQIYTHLDQQHKRKSMQKLDAFLEDASHVQVK